MEYEQFVEKYQIDLPPYLDDKFVSWGTLKATERGMAEKKNHLAFVVKIWESNMTIVRHNLDRKILKHLAYGKLEKLPIVRRFAPPNSVEPRNERDVWGVARDQDAPADDLMNRACPELVKQIRMDIKHGIDGTLNVMGTLDEEIRRNEALLEYYKEEHKQIREKWEAMDGPREELEPHDITPARVNLYALLKKKIVHFASLLDNTYVGQELVEIANSKLTVVGYSLGRNAAHAVQDMGEYKEAWSSKRNMEEEWEKIRALVEEINRK